MKGYDYSREIKHSKAYDKLRPLGVLVNKTQYKIEYVGTENVPDKGGFILAANHVGTLDPVFIAVGVKNRQIHYMGKKELFENPFTNWLFTKANAFPVARGKADSASLNYAIRDVKEGNILGIFPEGTRSKDGKMGRAKRGVAVIAKEAKADVLPVAFCSTDNFKKGTKLTVRFGKMIPFSELNLNDESSSEDLKAAAKYIMEKVAALQEEGHCK